MEIGWEETLEIIHGTNPGENTTTPGDGEDSNPPSGGNSNLTEEEKNKLEDNGIKELDKDEIKNENLKDNNNIKGVIEGEVPIPTGSEYKEGTKDTGVVVAFGENEFVWVPVPDINEMAILQEGSNSDYQGVLYSKNGSNLVKDSISKIGSTGYREPDVVSNDKATNLAILNTLLNKEYASTDETASSQFKYDLQSDFNNMVLSVAKYKGFYVGRYETSLDQNKKAYSKAGVLPATAAEDSANSWYGLYAYQRKMAEDWGYSCVDSYMIWECNYSALMKWASTGNDSSKVMNKGNAAHDLKAVYETGKSTIAGKEDKINNVYDLEGNGFEWTVGASSSSYRTLRGSGFSANSYQSNSYSYVPAGRGYSYQNGLNTYYCPGKEPTSKAVGFCSRLMLYIK